MTPEQKAAFHEAMIGALLENSSPVDEKPGYYGWLADDWRELYAHLEACGPDYPKCHWDDSEWTEFAGTFAPPEAGECKGIDMLLTCRCGEIEERAWRYRGEGYAELIRKITG